MIKNLEKQPNISMSEHILRRISSGNRNIYRVNEIPETVEETSQILNGCLDNLMEACQEGIPYHECYKNVCERI